MQSAGLKCDLGTKLKCKHRLSIRELDKMYFRELDRKKIKNKQNNGKKTTTLRVEYGSVGVGVKESFICAAKKKMAERKGMAKEKTRVRRKRRMGGWGGDGAKDEGRTGICE